MVQGKKNRDELLIAYLLGELNDQEAYEVSEWISMSEKNWNQFEQITQVWNAPKQNSESNFDANQAWNKVSPKIFSTPLFNTAWFKVAAVLMIVLGSIHVLFNLSGTDPNTIVFSELAIINDTLMDGSIITLNKSTRIEYAPSFNKNTREVNLQGEAFFDIERDTTKPFIIYLNQSMVKVLGTSFNIKSDPEDELVSVYVKSGVVLFEYLSNTADSSYLSVELSAGDKVVYNTDTKKLEPQSTSSTTNQDLYWINQELIFEGVELRKVAHILEAVYKIEVVFSNETTKKCLLTVNFQNARIEEIMEIIAFTFELELDHQKNTYTLIGKSCEEI
ncbi:MAG: transmembrane sensor [Salibacteraceae bacterium]|jgi:ferric-dicitrate binding protein FerR (iron transport regulator)